MSEPLRRTQSVCLVCLRRVEAAYHLRREEVWLEKTCPYDCGLRRKHRQASCCVLLEVTARCNLGCPVCFASSERAAAGRNFPPDPDLKQIAGWYDMLLEKDGPFNIQLSGGEPALRDDLLELIRLGVRRASAFFR